MMRKQTLSVFVDESGVLNKDDPTSRFYIIAHVAHDQSLPIADLAKRLDRELDSVGIANLCFHAGPIIHAYDQFMYMNWDLRRKIFYRMLAFANHVPFQYACLSVDKKFADDTETQTVVRGLPLPDEGASPPAHPPRRQLRTARVGTWSRVPSRFVMI